MIVVQVSITWSDDIAVVTKVFLKRDGNMTATRRDTIETAAPPARCTRARYVLGGRRSTLFGCRRVGARAQILRRLGPSADHPVALEFPEGDYLKGLLLRKS